MQKRVKILVIDETDNNNLLAEITCHVTMPDSKMPQAPLLTTVAALGSAYNKKNSQLSADYRQPPILTTGYRPS